MMMRKKVQSSKNSKKFEKFKKVVKGGKYKNNV